MDCQALIETALVIPVLLLLAFGVIAAGRVVHAQMGVTSVAREAARAAALANNRTEAAAQGAARGRAVAAGYQLTNGSLQISVDSGGFERGGQVRAAVNYRVSLADLPLLSTVGLSVSSDHVERIDLYRSRWPAGE